MVKNPSANTGDTGDDSREDMAAHSKVIASEIPGTEEPDGLQLMGLQRIGHD